MHRVTVNALLGSTREIDGLKRDRATAVEFLEQFQNRRSARKVTYSGAVTPKILLSVYIRIFACDCSELRNRVIDLIAREPVGQYDKAVAVKIRGVTARLGRC